MDRKVLILGCSRGLGHYIVNRMSALGYYYIIGVSRTSSENLNPLIHAKLNEYYSLDLGSKDQVLDLIQKVNEVDVLVLNASHRRFNLFVDFNGKELASLIESSFSNQLIILNYYLRRMKANNWGRIVFISSRAANNGYSYGSAYCSVKAAWLSVYQSLIKEINEDNVFLINFVPDSFSDNNGNTLAKNASVQNKLSKLLVGLHSINSHNQLYALGLKSRLLLMLKNIKNLKRV